MMDGMLAQRAALGVHDEAALTIAARGEPALHGFAKPIVFRAQYFPAVTGMGLDSRGFIVRTIDGDRRSLR